MPTKGRDLVIPDVSVPEFLWGQFIGRGHGVAIVDCSKNGASLTYREIYDQSRNCAAFLHQNGVKHGDSIALCSRSPLDFTVAMLGIMGCGATVAPCNPEYKYGEILQRFTISEPKMVFVDESSVETMKNVKAELPCLKTIFVIGKSDEFATLDSILRSTSDMGFLNNVKINPSEDIAMLPYSSGTTGLPKSVMLTHRNLVAWIVIMTECLQWREGHAFYTDRPMYHAGGFAHNLFVLNIGMKVISQKEFQVYQMLKTIEKYKVNYITTTPPVLIELSNAENANNYDTSSLLEIFFIGSPIAPDIVQRVAKKFNVTMLQGYGTTESLLISTNRTDGGSASSGGIICPAKEVKIVDLGTSKECHMNQNGEILVRGPQVMKGYLKNPQATANTIGNYGWMHTGDIGHLDKDRKLQVIGRLKEMIKFKTLQVPPAELESVILKHPKVADVGVIGIPDPAAGELPKAFIVKKDSNLTEQEIDAFVKNQLVDYKQLRGGVEFVKSIPKSVTGKIQRNELKKMAGVEI